VTRRELYRTPHCSLHETIEFSLEATFNEKVFDCLAGGSSRFVAAGPAGMAVGMTPLDFHLVAWYIFQHSPLIVLTTQDLFTNGKTPMNPFELFQSSGIYKLAVLYFSRSRGLAIVGRHTSDDNVEVIQISGEVDPHTGNFIALDYTGSDREGHFPVVSKKDFENLVSFIAGKIDNQTRMSVIEPDLIQAMTSQSDPSEPGKFLH